mgnify:FL=1
MSLVGRYLRNRPQHLRITPEELLKRGEDVWKPAHTDRSWEHFWVLRAAALSSGQRHLVADIAEGTVGSPGLEFLSWERDLNLGDPEDIIANPRGYAIPEEDDRAFAVANMVVNAIIQDNTPDRWDRGWVFLSHLEEKNRGDIAALSAMELARNPGERKGLAPGIRVFIPLLAKAGIIPGGE